MEARIVGPASELGVFDTLTVFGNPLSREWAPLTVTPEQLEKLQGNRFIDIRGQGSKTKITPEEAAASHQQASTTDAIKARLTELGVDFDGRAGREKLEKLLTEAEAAQAKAEEEEAERLQADAEAAGQP